jgi:hypothetical protein
MEAQEPQYTWVGLDRLHHEGATPHLWHCTEHGGHDWEGILWIRGVHTEESADGRALLAAYLLSDWIAPLLPSNDPRLRALAAL